MKPSVIRWNPKARPQKPADCEVHIPWFFADWTGPGLCIYMSLAPGWALKLCFWDFFSRITVTSHSWLCPELLNDHRRDFWSDSVSHGSNTQPDMCSDLQAEPKFPPRFGCFPPSVLLSPSLTQSKLMKEPTTHKIKTRDCKKGTGPPRLL